MTVKLSEYQQTMLQQLGHLHSYWRGEFGVTQIIKVDEVTLRFPFRVGHRKVNVDLTYDKGADLYNVKATDVNRFMKKTMTFDFNPEDWDKVTQECTVLDITGLFWDQLIDTFREIASKVGN